MERNGFGAFSIIAAFVLLLALFLAAPAKASEVRVGFGINCGVLVGDGYWTQEGLPYELTRCHESVTLQYIGQTRFKWLDYSVGAFYRKGAVSRGEFVSDECYGARQFSGGALINVGGTIMGACDRRYHAKKVVPQTHGLTFTINPTWKVNRDVSLSAGIGASLFHSTLRVEWDKTKGVCSISECENAVSKRTSISPYIEFTASYGNAFVTAYKVPMERVKDTVSDGNEGIVAGYKWIF